MYLAIDIGGTKTLVACWASDGKLLDQVKFPTPKDYQTFLNELTDNVASLSTPKLRLGVVAVPGLVNREEGLVYALGNLPWRNERIRDDISKKLGGLKMIIENDARLAGLAEAVLLKGTYKRVLYLTLSTGIGGALLEDGYIAKVLEDTEMGKMPLIFEGRLTHWEEFASGRAIVNSFGKKAREITDPKTWEKIGSRIAYGLGAACSVLQPEVVVFGGGLGQFVNKFGPTVAAYLDKELHVIVNRPKALLQAQHKEDGVIYGCYELAKAAHGMAR